MFSSHYCQRCHQNEVKVLITDGKSYVPTLCDKCALFVFGEVEADNFTEEELEQINNLDKKTLN